MQILGEPSTASFFVTGGTLSTSASCYIMRQADTDLFQSLLAGEFCYVLNSRQMGKSSLMVRTAERLKAEGVTVAVLDLTAIGQNLTPEQWYDGLLARLGRQLNLEDELEAFYERRSKLSPLQRWQEALTQVVLPAVAGRLVLFIDEIDVVRSLPFSADEFFAAIRQCYVGRATDPLLHRLCICLLGTATPADLISDTRTSPFNIGKRVEVLDFTPEEAAPLAEGFSRQHRTANDEQRQLLDRVLYWTGGHPYLTQRLCRAVAEATIKKPHLAQNGEHNAVTPPTLNLPHAKPDSLLPTCASVDKICSELFLTQKAKETDDNLTFVRNRLLRSEVDLAALLDLYRQMRDGRRVPYDETNPFCPVMRLSGVAKVRNGLLLVRNRIYAGVFDRAWVEAHMPDAERRRQRAAYRAGVARTAGVAGAVLLAVAAFALVAWHQTKEAKRLANLMVAKTILLGSSERKARDAAITAQQSEATATNLAKRLTKSLQMERVAELKAIGAAKAAKDNAARAGREARIADEQRKLARNEADVSERQFYYATMGQIQNDWDHNNVAHVLELLRQTRNSKERGFEWGYWNHVCRADAIANLGTTNAHDNGIWALAQTQDGRRAVTSGDDGTVKVWDLTKNRVIVTLPGDNAPVKGLDISRDGKRIVTGSDSGTARVWDAETGAELTRFNSHYAKVYCTVFLDANRVLSGSEPSAGSTRGVLKIWDAHTGQELAAPFGHVDTVFKAAVAPDGTRFATGSWDNTARIWTAATKLTKPIILNHPDWVTAVSFSPDSKRVITGDRDGVARVWDAVTGRHLFDLKGHTAEVTDAEFSMDGTRIATASIDMTARIWNADTGIPIQICRGHAGQVRAAQFSPDGAKLITVSTDGTLRTWKVGAEPATLTLRYHAALQDIHFLNKGSMVVIRHWQPSGVAQWDTGSGRLIRDRSDTLPTLVTGATTSVAGPGPDRLTVGFRDGRVTVYDLTGHTGPISLTGPKGRQAPVRRIACSEDASVIAAAGDDRIIRVFDARKGHEIAHFAAHAANGANELCVAPYGTRIAATYADGWVLIYDLIRGRTIFDHAVSSSWFTRATFSNDASRLCVARSDKVAEVLFLNQSRPPLILRGHTEQLWALAFSPDNRRVATGGHDFTIKLWDGENGNETLTLSEHVSDIQAIAFSPDGTHLVSSSFDNTARVRTSDLQPQPTITHVRPLRRR